MVYSFKNIFLFEILMNLKCHQFLFAEKKTRLIIVKVNSFGVICIYLFEYILVIFNIWGKE